jgi:Gpi18-like mannosyltransferase
LKKKVWKPQQQQKNFWLKLSLSCSQTDFPQSSSNFKNANKNRLSMYDYIHNNTVKL